MCRTHLTPTPFTASTMVLLVGARRIERARGRDVLAAGRRRVEIVDDHDHAVLLVVDGVGDAGGQPVVPEAAVANHRDRLLAGFDVERGGRRRAQPVAHGRRADVEWRQAGEQMAADVAGDLVLGRVPAARASSRRRSAAPGSRCRSPAAAAARTSRASLTFGSASTLDASGGGGAIAEQTLCRAARERP